MSVLYIRDKDGNFVQVPSINAGSGSSDDSRLMVVTVNTSTYSVSHDAQAIYDHVMAGGIAFLYDDAEKDEHTRGGVYHLAYTNWELAMPHVSFINVSVEAGAQTIKYIDIGPIYENGIQKRYGS